MPEETNAASGATETSTTAPTTTTSATTTSATTNSDAPWYSAAESLKTSDPATWETFEKGVKAGGHKDLPTFVKNAINLEKKLGYALFIPDKSKAEDVKTFKSKLTEAGFLPKVPDSADSYQVKLDSVPEKLRSPELVGAFQKIAHEEGLSQGAVDKITGLYNKMFTEQVQPVLKYTEEQGSAAIKEFAQSIGKEPNVVEQYAGAWLAKNFTEEDLRALESVGMANSPAMVKFAARAGLDTGEDISVGGDGVVVPDMEMDAFFKTLKDPSHENYKLLFDINQRQNPKRQAVLDKREAYWKQQKGTGEVT